MPAECVVKGSLFHPWLSVALAPWVHGLLACDALANHVASWHELLGPKSTLPVAMCWQVLFDVLGREELSDYLALLVPQRDGRNGCSCRKGHSAAAAATAAGGSPATHSSGVASSTCPLRGASSMGERAVGQLTQCCWLAKCSTAAAAATHATANPAHVTAVCL